MKIKNIPIFLIFFISLSCEYRLKSDLEKQCNENFTILYSSINTPESSSSEKDENLFIITLGYQLCLMDARRLGSPTPSF